MGDDITASVVKRGETVINVVLHRTAVGLSIQVKTVPIIEDFMRNLGGGETVSVSTVGRHWVPAKKGEDLVAYVISTLPKDRNHASTVDALGSPLMMADGRGQEIINLSFLRLVGISGGGGVNFGVKGVYSLDGLRKLRDRIVVSSRDFYVDFLRPVDLSVKVVTQELQL